MNADWHNASINYALQNVSTVTDCKTVAAALKGAGERPREVARRRLPRRRASRSRSGRSTSRSRGPHDVLVRMAAVGICGTELHSIRGEWERPTPTVLGHEGAGVVEAVGDDVTSVKPGDEVVLSWAPSCGECADCRRGRPAACVNLHRAIGERHARRRHDRDDARRRDALPRHGDGVRCTERVVVTERVALPLGERRPARGGGAARLRGADRRRRGAVRRRRPSPASPCSSSAPAASASSASRARGSPARRRSSCVDPLEARLELARELGATHATDPDGLKALMKQVAARRRRQGASTSSATPRRRRSRFASPAAAARA